MKSTDVIAGLKLIKVTGRINLIDDPTFPFRLDVNLRPPELMQVAFILMHGGTEQIVVRAMTRDAIDRFIELNALKTHPRLRRMTILGPDIAEIFGPEAEQGIPGTRLIVEERR